MPLIQIESLKTDRNIEKAINRIIDNAAEKTVFQRDRLIIKWNFTNTDMLFRHGKKIENFTDEKNPILVSLTLSKRNQREDAEALVNIIVESISEAMDFDSKNVILVINHLDEGNIFVGNSYI